MLATLELGRLRNIAWHALFALLLLGAIGFAHSLDPGRFANRHDVHGWYGAPMVLAGLLALSLAFHRGLWRTDRTAFVMRASWTLLALLVAAASLQISASRSMWASASPYLIAGALLVPLTCWPLDSRFVEWLARGTAVLLALSVLVDYADWWPIYQTAKLDNVNFPAEYIALAIPILLAVAVRRRRVPFELLVLIPALVVSRCRTAWLGTACAVAVVLWLTIRVDRRSRRFLALGGAVLLGACLLGGMLPGRLRFANPDKPDNLTTLRKVFDLDSQSGHFRKLEYVTAGRLLANAGPLGIGPGRWHREARRLTSELGIYQVPHSDYLRSATDGGVLGLVAFLAFLAAAGLRAFRVRARRPEALAFFAALLIVVATDAPFYRFDSLLFVLIFATAREPAATAVVSAASEPPRHTLPIACSASPLVDGNYRNLFS